MVAAARQPCSARRAARLGDCTVGRRARRARPPSTSIVDLGRSDHDRARPRRRERHRWCRRPCSPTPTRRDADHARARVVGDGLRRDRRTTRCRSPRKPCCAPTSSSSTPASSRRPRQLVDEWRLARAGRSTTVLRPAIALAADGSSSARHGARRRASASGSARTTRRRSSCISTTSPSAVALAVERRLDGVFNVAPDGWVAGERVRALSGERPRLPLPDRVAECVGRLRWRFQRGPIPPGLRATRVEPWLGRQRPAAQQRVGADGHQRAGLRRGHRAKWWTMVTPKRRQELILGGGVAAALSAVAVAVLFGRRSYRRRRSLRGR